MDTFGQILKGLVDNPTACMLCLALLALGFMYRARAQDTKDFIAMILSQEAAHRETLVKVIPIAEKLTESVVILDRLSQKE